MLLILISPVNFFTLIELLGSCAGENFCHAQTNDKTAQSVCKSMGGTNPVANALFSGFTRYRLP